MSDWTPLATELDAWSATGREATFWWRDDDAVADTARLAPLLDLVALHCVPVALAVVPRGLEDSLAAAIAGHPQVRVVQHGYAHANHGPPGARPVELGARPLEEILDELRNGAALLSRAFPAAFAPVLVPPWNRIDPAVVPRLPDVGLRGLSTFAPRRALRPAPGLVACNTHADPIAWHDGRRFAGHDAALAAVVAHLAARRSGHVDGAEPTGLLTHHLVFDDAAWRFVAGLLECTLGRRARWVGVGEAFALLPPPAGLPYP